MFYLLVNIITQCIHAAIDEAANGATVNERTDHCRLPPSGGRRGRASNELIRNWTFLL